MHESRETRGYPILKKEIINHSRQRTCCTVIIENKGAGQHLIQEFWQVIVPVRL
jgi:hypothetical protein